MADAQEVITAAREDRRSRIRETKRGVAQRQRPYPCPARSSSGVAPRAIICACSCSPASAPPPSVLDMRANTPDSLANGSSVWQGQPSGRRSVLARVPRRSSHADRRFCLPHPARDIAREEGENATQEPGRGDQELISRPLPAADASSAMPAPSAYRRSAAGSRGATAASPAPPRGVRPVHGHEGRLERSAAVTHA